MSSILNVIMIYYIRNEGIKKFICLLPENKKIVMMPPQKKPLRASHGQILPFMWGL